MATKADVAAEQYARGLYALDYEPQPEDAFREGYEQAQFDARDAASPSVEEALAKLREKYPYNELSVRLVSGSLMREWCVITIGDKSIYRATLPEALAAALNGGSK